MRPTETLIGQPVRALQTMLRTIGIAEQQETSVIPDGFYGRQTAGSISEFQRRHRLPVSGIVDLLTWEAIVSHYALSNTQIGSAQNIEVVLNPHSTFRSGDANPWILLSQCMLYTLSGHYRLRTCVSMTGRMDSETTACVSEFQNLSGLPETGQIDRNTWKHLSLQFSLCASQMCQSKS